jgi:Ni,Fe-hydrogenase maturation factor
MTLFLFGNPNIKTDSLPLKILPALKKLFPNADFQLKDPNEDFELPAAAIIIDCVAGLKEPRIFESVDELEPPPRLTLHDFDLYSHLQLLKKLGKLPGNLKIIGLPPEISEEEAIDFIESTLLT